MDHPRYRNVENIKDETLKALTIGFIDLIQDNKIYGSGTFQHILRHLQCAARRILLIFK
jgi:hypothetical protein